MRVEQPGDYGEPLIVHPTMVSVLDGAWVAGAAVGAWVFGSLLWAAIGAAFCVCIRALCGGNPHKARCGFGRGGGGRGAGRLNPYRSSRVVSQENNDRRLS